MLLDQLRHSSRLEQFDNLQKLHDLVKACEFYNPLQMRVYGHSQLAIVVHLVLGSEHIDVDIGVAEYPQVSSERLLILIQQENLGLGLGGPVGLAQDYVELDTGDALSSHGVLD